MKRISIKKLILEHPQKVLILDGGQGTELENRGININSPVWSAAPFTSDSFWQQSSHERKVVEEMYKDFMDAGANVLMTITYQANFKSISENTSIKTLDAYKHFLDKIVSFTREFIGEDRYLIGSIGPWAAHVSCEYTGDYGPHPENIDYYSFFKPQLNNFNENKDIDLIGFETVPNFHELKAILSWGEDLISKPFYIGLSVDDSGLLRDGTPLKEISAHIKGLGSEINKNLLLMGVNCVSFNQSALILETLHVNLPGMPLLIYPNSGEIYDPKEKTWHRPTDKLDSWDIIVKKYVDNGARIIGGCCRTSPKDIAEIASAVDKY
ncbi:S-adenosylmethionine-homocysteine S-methyltransferase MHT1 [Saccharomyces paradoxus]|uniref:homocysteine S-methyltransferase n=1 Tax=Saccharomyces paradoxus TaxID=27291 RepID=A0A8B8UVD0_SACPA|nr:Mht1 [Saccharomyces paradoxus]QHS74692.1 Mht1 [Saccharomyces paradoxus]